MPAPDSTAPLTTVSPVDPRAPRFGQGLTASLLAAGIVLRAPWLVALVALTLTLAVVSRGGSIPTLSCGATWRSRWSAFPHEPKPPPRTGSPN